jgi:uncharacterized protein YggU (UPF0235/DUF167 family)
MPKSSRNFVKDEEGCLKVYVSKPAQDGLANEQLIEVLAKHLGVKKYQIKIIKGHRARNKIIEVNA